MDPPSLDEDIPEPKVRLSSEIPEDAPSVTPPPPPPSPPTVEVEEAVAQVEPEEDEEEEPLPELPSKQDPVPFTVSPALSAATTTPGPPLATETANGSKSPVSTPTKGKQSSSSSSSTTPAVPPEAFSPPTSPSVNKPSLSTPPPKPAETPILMPLSPKERNVSFEELRSYEAKRRSIYLKKLKSSSLYWRAFRDTLSKSYQETERAESLIQGSVVANGAYAEYLAAAAEDRLDYNGKPMMDDRRARKLQQDKLKKYSSLGGGSLLWGVAMDNPHTTMKKEKLEKAKSGPGNLNLEKSASFEGLPTGSILNTFIESHHDMAKKFHENYLFVKDVALERTSALRKELEQEVNIMSMLGDVTIYELEKAEDDVQKAWAAYYTLASLNAGSNMSTASTSTKAKNALDKNTVTDVWLVEMHYRMSVAYLTTIWEKCSAELSNLFASMKELECNRRFRLNELLILYAQRAERLWLSIPPLVTAVTKDLVTTPTDTETIERDVQTTIRDKAQDLQRKDAASMKADPMNAPGLAGVPDLKMGYELQSPLMSDLLGKSQVIWRKNEKLMSQWKPTLAVATSDCYLHLFDIPSYSNVQTGTAPEVAFQCLVPPVKIPTEDELINGNYPSGANWFDNLVPTDSIDLKVSKVTFSEGKGNSTFELTETLAPNKLSSVSNFIRKKKLNLRMYSSQHMVEWLLTLRNYGAE